MDQRTARLDPITLTVIQSGLQQVCNEMDLAFVRAAFSPVISEALDRSDGIYHPVTGELIAQGELGLPVFVGTMQFGTQAVIERARDLAPGDLYIVNDPYLGGTHLMDVRFVKPYFYRGELFAWLANTGHWPDTGGMVPGGFSANATEVEQEGLRLPPVKLFKGGVMDEEILAIILSNIRIADQRIGDIKAQAAALTVGERRLTALIDRYGRDTVEAGIEELKARAERQMRARIATIPDGRYHGRAFVDSDGVVDEPLTIDMRIEKAGTDLHFDMSGSSPPCAGPMNSVIATTRSSVYLAMKHIFPEVPINAGTFAPLHIADPDGTFLYARYPRPVSGCAAEVSQRIAEAVFNALTPAIPEQLFGAPAGTSGNFALGGHDPERGRAYVMYVISGGGYGGSPAGDGISNGCSTIGISKSTPVEVFEQLYPVLFEEYALHEGSGGAGEQRGGFGLRYRVRLRRGTANASFVMDHGRTGPLGALGGEDGGINVVIVTRDGVPYRPPHRSKDQGIVLQPGDTVEVRTPGGGGYGPAARRASDQVARDLRRGYYTAKEARERFRVCVSRRTGEVDHKATMTLRKKTERASGGDPRRRGVTVFRDEGRPRMKKLKTAAASVQDAIQAAPRKTSNAANAAVDGVVAGSNKALQTVTSLSDWLLSTSQGLLASRLSSDLNGLLANMVKGPATIYDKAMDAEYLATSIGGGNHRLFDGGHTILGAFKACRDASPDDTVVQEAMGFLQGMFRDMTTPKGLPLATWDKASHDQVAGFLKSNFGIPKDWFHDLNSYDAAELLGGTIGILSTALSWNRADTETFSKLVGSMGLSAVRGANPLLSIVTVVALARAFHKAHHAGDHTKVADGVLKGAVGTGATLVATSQIAALGGPAGWALLAGVCAGVLAHKATEKVSVAQIGRFAAARATATAKEIRHMANKLGRTKRRSHRRGRTRAGTRRGPK